MIRIQHEQRHRPPRMTRDLLTRGTNDLLAVRPEHLDMAPERDERNAVAAASKLTRESRLTRRVTITSNDSPIRRSGCRC